METLEAKLLTLPDTETKLLHMFDALHGEITGSCSRCIYYSEDMECRVAGVNLMKDGYVAWFATKEDILFDYLTRDIAVPVPTRHDTQEGRSES